VLVLGEIFAEVHVTHAAALYELDDPKSPSQEFARLKSPTASSEVSGTFLT
jgi:hypothetical protein